MPISSNGSKLTVETVYGDKTVTNADSISQTYGANQQREPRKTNVEGSMNAVYGINFLKEEDRIVDTGAPVIEANKQDLKKRNLK